jgi:TonB family protein
VDVPETPPGSEVDVDATVTKILAEREEAQRQQNEEKLKALEAQLAEAQAAKQGEAAPAVQPTPTPAAAPPPAAAPVETAQTPEPAPPPPAPEPVRAEEKPPPAPEPRREPEPAPAAPRARQGDLVEPGAGVIPPQLVSFPKPEYPPMARNLRVEGVVVVSVLVDENGQVQDARIAEPIKQKVGLNEAAVAAARSARYKPATKDGVRVKMWTRLRIPFKL